MLLEAGWSRAQVALLVDSIAAAKSDTIDPGQLVDLVLSGPDVPGVPTADTAAVVRTMIEDANLEVLLVGYAIHNGRRLFEPLAGRLGKVEGLKVTFCLDIARRPNDTSLDEEVVRRFALEFRKEHWPWPSLPEVYYDPRALVEDRSKRASLHAKCIVVDRKVALVTSANFTQAAQEKNCEAGILVRYEPLVARLAAYFAALIASRRLLRCRLPGQ